MNVGEFDVSISKNGKALFELEVSKITFVPSKYDL